MVRFAFAALMLGGGATAADELLLHVADCRIVDQRGPLKALGVNYVDGFWNYANDGDRSAYLPYLDALAEAKIPFIRMAFGPWASDREGASPAPQIADFVAHRDRYFERLDAFLTDLKTRHIGAVLDVFWNVDPYTVHFGEPATARVRPGSRTAAFLSDTVAELGRRFGQDPRIWMIEFLNEGDLDIDYNRGHHTRADLVALMENLATALRGSGDRHLIDSGNSLPRPAAEHLSEHQGWKVDDLDSFLRALDAETPPGVDVASVHVYPEKTSTRPWDDADVMNALPVLVKHSQQSCKPAFIGEFGANDLATEERYISEIAASGIQIAAVWGFARKGEFPQAFGIDGRGRDLLRLLTRTDQRQ